MAEELAPYNIDGPIRMIEPISSDSGEPRGCCSGAPPVLRCLAAPRMERKPIALPQEDQHAHDSEPNWTDVRPN